MGISQKDFDELIKNSCNKGKNLGNKHYCINNGIYFNSKYKNELKKKIDDSNLYIKFPRREFNSNKKRLIKICSVASSSRLTFLYFYNQMCKNIKLEYPCKNGVHGNSYFDAYDEQNNIFYECKCHEICNKSGHSKLSIAYKSKLENLFDIKNLKKDKTNKHFEISFGDLRVNDCSKESCSTSIYKLHLDVKQLICHLIAMQNDESDKEKHLQYIFFVPDEYNNKKDKNVNELYKSLVSEWKAVINSKSFKAFKTKNKNIFIEEPIFYPCSKIEDCII